MGGYIKLDKGQIDDPRIVNAGMELGKSWKVVAPNPDQFASATGQVLDVEATCGLMRNVLLGVTHALWVYADSHVYSDDALRVTLDALASELGIPVSILRMLPEQWLRVRADGFVELPGYCAKNNVRGKDLRKNDADEKREHQRRQNAERQQRHRDKVKRERLKTVTQKSSRSRNGVTPPTGTGTGTVSLTGTVPQRAATRAGSGDPAPPREESADVTAQRAKLRGVVAGLRATKGVKPT